MARITLSEHMREQRLTAEPKPERAGPYVTISRQFGCYGFSLGLLLMEILNEDADSEHTWRIYHKEILSRLATQTNMAKELLEKERRSKPRMLVHFFRSFSGEKVPSGHEIRNRITTIVRGLAIEGHAIVVGQGGAAATRDLPNGLTIRLEAPEDWRVKQVAFREGLSETKSRERIREKEEEREYLRKLYEAKSARGPGFHIVYDCSVFSLAQIAQHVVAAMRFRGLL